MSQPNPGKGAPAVYQVLSGAGSKDLIALLGAVPTYFHCLTAGEVSLTRLDGVAVPLAGTFALAVGDTLRVQATEMTLDASAEVLVGCALR